MKPLILIWILTAIPLWAATSETAAEMQSAILKSPDLKKVKLLLDDGFDCSQAIGCGDYDALDAAVATGNAELVELLLRYGAKPKPATVANAAFLPSHDAALILVRMFLTSGADPNSSNGYSTALHQAVFRENIPLVSLLLSQKSITLNALNVDDRTPLILSVEKGNPQLVEMLLKAGADASFKNSKGLSAADFSKRMIADQQNLQALLARSHE